MKRDMIRPPPLGPDGIALEYSILVTNLLQCKAGKPAAQNVNPTAAVVSGSSSSIQLFAGNPSGGAPPTSGGGMGSGMMGAPEFVVSGESVTVPGNTLIAVPAGQTLFARRTGAGSAAGAPTESTPAPPIAAGIAGALRAGAGGPGATGTFASSIDNSGRIVGYYFDEKGEKHGFVAAKVPEPSAALGMLAILGVGTVNIWKKSRQAHFKIGK
jgi:hypothetical protein